MCLCNELCCETRNFSHCLNPKGFYSQRFGGFISPHWNPGLQTFSLPSCSNWFILMQMWDRPVATLPAWSSRHHLATCPLCPSDQSECFFFGSLVVSLPYNLVFWQFWLFFKFVVFFLLVCKETKCIYLQLYLGWKSHFSF